MEKGLVQLDLSTSQYVVTENDLHRGAKSANSRNTSSNKVTKGGTGTIADGMLSGIRNGTGRGRHFMDTSGMLGLPNSTHNNTKISKFIGVIPVSGSQIDANTNRFQIQDVVEEGNSFKLDTSVTTFSPT